MSKTHRVTRGVRQAAGFFRLRLPLIPSFDVPLEPKKSLDITCWDLQSQSPVHIAIDFPLARTKVVSMLPFFPDVAGDEMMKCESGHIRQLMSPEFNWGCSKLWFPKTALTRRFRESFVQQNRDREL